MIKRAIFLGCLATFGLGFAGLAHANYYQGQRSAHQSECYAYAPSSDQYGNPQYSQYGGSPSYQDQYSQPQYGGQGQYGSPSYQDQYSQPQYGGQGQYGSPSYQDQYSQPQYGGQGQHGGSPSYQDQYNRPQQGDQGQYGKQQSQYQSRQNQYGQEQSNDFPQDHSASASDAQLNKKIRDKISKGWFGSTYYEEIALRTSNGIVVLEGLVEGPEEQQKLINEIRKIEGVRDVRSNLSVKPNNARSY